VQLAVRGGDCGPVSPHLASGTLDLFHVNPCNALPVTASRDREWRESACANAPP
jgi:hypothetical protein